MIWCRIILTSKRSMSSDAHIEFTFGICALGALVSLVLLFPVPLHSLRTHVRFVSFIELCVDAIREELCPCPPMRLACFFVTGPHDQKFWFDSSWKSSGIGSRCPCTVACSFGTRRCSSSSQWPLLHGRSVCVLACTIWSPLIGLPSEWMLTCVRACG